MKNRAELIGYLGSDPVMKEVNGDVVCNLNLATTEKYTDKKTGELKKDTQWHNISVWGKQGENCSKYLKKGSLICVEGKLRYKKVEEKAGYFTEIRANNVIFLDRAPIEF